MIQPIKLMPTDAKERKACPIWSGVLEYFPNALIAVSRCSFDGNLQHHPDKPLHWDMSKSTDEMDALMRHAVDGDWENVLWRAAAQLEREIQKGYVPKSFQTQGVPEVDAKEAEEPTSDPSILCESYILWARSIGWQYRGKTNTWVKGLAGCTDERMRELHVQNFYSQKKPKPNQQGSSKNIGPVALDCNGEVL